MPAVILLAEAGYSNQSSGAIVLYPMPSVVQDERMFGSSSLSKRPDGQRWPQRRRPIAPERWEASAISPILKVTTVRL
jgi:hypothetical protein